MRYRRTMMGLSAAALAAAAVWPMTAEAGPQGPAAEPSAWALERADAPRPAWNRADPADSLYRAGRSAIMDGDYAEAAALFRELVERHPESAYAGDALYWEAFARQRLGGSTNLQAALRALELQRERYPDAATRGDAEQLRLRIQGQLAGMGDPDAARAVASEAEHVLGVDWEKFAREVATITKEATAVAMAEAQRALADPRLHEEVSRATREAMETAREAMAQAEAEIRGHRAAHDPCPEQADKHEMQIMALEALLEADPERTVPVLREILGRTDECSARLRRAALFLMADEPSPGTEALLIEIAKTDPDPRLRRDALYALADEPSPRVLALLRETIETADDPRLQEAALHALSEADDGESRALLREIAAKPGAPERVRRTAIIMLGDDATPEDAAFLRELFGTLDDPRLKEHALFALAEASDELDDPQVGRWLLEIALDADQPMQVRKHALYLTADETDVPTAELAALYDRLDDREMKKQLVFALTEREDEAAVTTLIRIARTEKDPELRKAAVFWLAESDDPRALEVLREILQQ